jgi:short-subunit dehydrogenase
LSYIVTGYFVIADTKKRKTIVIAGAANGLGHAISAVFATRGWELALLDVDRENGLKTVSQLTASGAVAEFYPLDVSVASEWTPLKTKLQARWEHLDLLVNCAAQLSVGATGSQSLEIEQATVNVTLLGTVFACETMVPWLVENPSGSQIINVASCAAFLGMPWSATYNASKAGIVAYSETLHNELSPRGVSVTIACPGFFPSGLFDSAKYSSPDLQRTVNHVVNKSTIDPAEVAAEIYAAVERKQLYLMTPFAVRKLWWFKRLFPRRLLRSIGGKAHALRRRFADG